MGEGSGMNLVMNSISIRLGVNIWVLDTNGIQHIIMRGYQHEGRGIQMEFNTLGCSSLVIVMKLLPLQLQLQLLLLHMYCCIRLYCQFGIHNQQPLKFELC